jgi:hypothetical protein
MNTETEMTLAELVAMFGGRITGNMPARNLVLVRPENKTIRELWESTPRGQAIHALNYQTLVAVLWEKTRYTVEHAGKIIPGFWDSTPERAVKLILKHHEDMMRREGEKFWQELWEMKRKQFLDS